MKAHATDAAVTRRKAATASDASWDALPLEVREMILTYLLHNMLEGGYETIWTELRRLLAGDDAFLSDLARPLKKFAQHLAHLETCRETIVEGFRNTINGVNRGECPSVTPEQMDALEQGRLEAREDLSKYECCRRFAVDAVKRIG